MTVGEKVYFHQNSIITNFGDQIIKEEILVREDSGPIINISFYDELTEELINNISYKIFTPDGAAFSGNTTTGNLYNSGSEYGRTGILEISYDNPNYYERKYFITLTNTLNTTLKFYLLNKTLANNQLVTYTVTDQDGNILPGAILKALRRYVSDSATVFEVVEMSKSDFNSEGGLHLELNDATYKFFVEYNGNIILRTDETQIFGNAITLRSDLASSVITSTIATTELNVSFSFDESTLNLTTNYNDPSGVTTKLCVDIKRIGYAITTVNSSCLSATTGSIILGVPNATGEYRVYATQYTNTIYSEKPAGLFSFTLASIKETIGISGIFYLLMFVIMGALIGMTIFQTAQHTISLAAIGFVIGILFKITEFGWTAGISALTVAGFLIYVTKQKGVNG